MTRFEDVKGGDLYQNAFFTGVFMGLPVPDYKVGGHSGLPISTVSGGIPTYHIIQGRGDFQSISQDQWDRVLKDYMPRSSNPELSDQLLHSAKQDISNKGSSDLGVLELMDTSEVMAAIDNILRPN